MTRLEKFRIHARIVVDNNWRDGTMTPYPTRTTQQKDATMTWEAKKTNELFDRLEADLPEICNLKAAVFSMVYRLKSAGYAEDVALAKAMKHYHIG